MSRWRVGENRGSKEKDRCPLILLVLPSQQQAFTAFQAAEAVRHAAEAARRAAEAVRCAAETKLAIEAARAEPPYSSSRATTLALLEQ
jgi:hypothetical protein